MAENTGVPDLTPGAKKILDEVIARQKQVGREAPSGDDWLIVIVERHGAMAEDLAQEFQAPDVRRQLEDKAATPRPPLSAEEVLARAAELARASGRQMISERMLTVVVLHATGYTLAPSEDESSSSATPSATAATDPGGGTSTTEGSTPGGFKPRCTKRTPELERYGRDLTAEAAAGKLLPVVGREDEVQLMMETLCRRTKRNPVLVGPAGVGKTAIVEGLAQRIVKGEVPDMLRAMRLIALSPSALVSGSGIVGELEKRMQAILQEARYEGILLFIDEVHSIIGSGGRAGSGDIASQLKPALARGDLACIAATTDNEYRQFIEKDEALERRFQPVRVQELTVEETLQVLFSLRDNLQALRGVQVPDEVVRILVDFAGQYMQNRNFPDKGVDLLEQCVAAALIRGETSVTVETARTVAERMVGIPLDRVAQLSELHDHFIASALLSPEEARALVDRLDVTMRGLDMRPQRPNLVTLLLGTAADSAGNLARQLAETLLGSAERIVHLDFSALQDHWSVATLLGSPPGYVGYDDNLPLHMVAQMPWCVLICSNVDQCHPAVRAILTGALEEGVMRQNNGKNIFLSDAMVILTATLEINADKMMGLRRRTAEPPARRQEDLRDEAAKRLGNELMDQVDVICAGSQHEASAAWIEGHLLPELTERYRKQSLHLQWDPSFVHWLQVEHGSNLNERAWERLVDSQITPRLLTALGAGGGGGRTLVIKHAGSGVQVEQLKSES